MKGSVSVKNLGLLSANDLQLEDFTWKMLKFIFLDATKKISREEIEFVEIMEHQSNSFMKWCE
jgi:hypothetical protein